jgi:hypothetical protein
METLVHLTPSSQAEQSVDFLTAQLKWVENNHQQGWKAPQAEDLVFTPDEYPVTHLMSEQPSLETVAALPNKESTPYTTAGRNLSPWFAPEANTRVPFAHEIAAQPLPASELLRPLGHNALSSQLELVLSTPNGRVAPDNGNFLSRGIYRMTTHPSGREQYPFNPNHPWRGQFNFSRAFNQSYAELGKGLAYYLRRAGRSLTDSYRHMHVENIQGKASLRNIEASLHEKGRDKHGELKDQDWTEKIARRRYQAAKLRAKAHFKAEKAQRIITSRKPLTNPFTR